jgi:hypothetical protein
MPPGTTSPMPTRATGPPSSSSATPSEVRDGDPGESSRAIVTAFPVAGAFVVALPSKSRRFENLAREPGRQGREHSPQRR